MAAISPLDDKHSRPSSALALPHYAGLLSARHAAHEPELRKFLATHWQGRTLDVLDVACGDGFYATAFQKLLGPDSRIVAVDVSEAFLDVAEGQADREWRPDGGRGKPPIEFLRTKAEQLPFPDGCFDLVWCAQSLISLPDVPAALQEMRRVARRGGQVGILENDPLHEIILPWPVDLELALRAADRQRIAATSKSPETGRRLLDLLRDVGLNPISRSTLAIDRLSPLTPADTRFTELYLKELARRLVGWLPEAQAAELRQSSQRMAEAAGEAEGSFWMTWNDTIVISMRV